MRRQPASPPRFLRGKTSRTEGSDLKLDETQRRQLEENVKKAQRDLREAVWRTYKNVLLLGKDGNLADGRPRPCSLERRGDHRHTGREPPEREGRHRGRPEPAVLVRNWPPAFVEWSTRGVRDACYASPQFPRLLDPEAIKRTISKGVESGAIAYVGRSLMAATSLSSGAKARRRRSGRKRSRSRMTCSSSVARPLKQWRQERHRPRRRAHLDRSRLLSSRRPQAHHPDNSHSLQATPQPSGSLGSSGGRRTAPEVDELLHQGPRPLRHPGRPQRRPTGLRGSPPAASRSSRSTRCGRRCGSWD